MKVVSIFGNVGVGKSTLLRNLEREHYSVYYEPEEFWDPFFKLYMKDPKQWAASFQMIVLKGYEEMYKKIMSENNVKDTNKVIVIERGLECCTAFCKWLIHQGQLTQEQVDAIEEYKSHIQWFENVEYVYLKAHPVVCANRALQRENELNPCEISYMEFLNKEWEKRVATHVIYAEWTPESILEDFKKIYTRTKIVSIKSTVEGFYVAVEGDLPFDLEQEQIEWCHRTQKPVYTMLLNKLPPSLNKDC